MDTGLDETSCFFADDDGLQVEHGHVFDGFRQEPDGNVSPVLGDSSFAYDMSRRKVCLGCGGGVKHEVNVVVRSARCTLHIRVATFESIR